MSQSGKTIIGIVGGMGPLATSDLFRMIVENTQSQDDKGHIHIIVDDYPQIPDRTNAIIHKGESPVPYIITSVKMLESFGASIILIPCNTSHFYVDEIQRKVHAKIINMIEVTAKRIRDAGIKRVGLIATEGTIQSGIYERWLSEFGVEIVLPNKKQQRTIMEFIYKAVKAGNLGFDVTEMQKVIDSLSAQGVETVILGCTEIYSGIKLFNLRIGNYVEPMYILARESISVAGYELTDNGALFDRRKGL